MLQRDEFCLSFENIRFPGDGHCQIHPFITCLKHLCHKTDDKSILKMLVTEWTTNSDRYLARYIGGADLIK